MECGLPNFHPRNPGSGPGSGTTLSEQSWNGAEKKWADRFSSLKIFKNNKNIFFKEENCYEIRACYGVAERNRQHKVEEAGLDVQEAAEELLGMGFTVDELIQDFDFDAEDLEDFASSDDDDDDKDDDDDDDDEDD